jgi:uncharacterized protein YkwD
MDRFRLLALFLAVSFLVPILQISEGLAAFSDVPGGHPYKASIDFVQQEGIVSGYADGTYQPERILNRAEFTKIIIESRYDANTINSCVNRGGFYEKALFTDVEPGVWFEKYVCVAKKEGIIQGYSDGTFRPIQTIIFAEAAKIAIESYGLTAGSGDPWFAPYLDKLASLDAVPPSLASIPDQTQRGIKDMSRGEMADVIFRLKTVQDTIVSNDGNFAIKVPETSLPSGLTADKISITRLSDAEQPVKEVNGAPMLFYKLEPDGIEFREPVTFTVETDTIANTVPMVFLVSGDSFDLISDPTIEINQSKKTAFLTAQINHFSHVAIGFADYFEVGEVTIDPMGNQSIDNPFKANLNIKRTAAAPTFVLQSNNDTIDIETDWTLDSVFFESIPGSLDPYVVQLPSKSKSAATDYAFSGDFDCSVSGADKTQVEYQGSINWKYTFNGSNKTSTSVIRSISEPFVCEGLDPLQAQYEIWKKHAFDNINLLRSQNGIGPLKYNALLSDIATVHAKDMAINIGELSHQGSLGEESWIRIKEGKVIDFNSNDYTFMSFASGIDRSGENIGRRNVDFFSGDAQQAIEDQHQWFMDTPDEGVTHRTTMLSKSANFSEIGIGLYLDDNQDLWIVENFISLK